LSQSEVKKVAIPSLQSLYNTSEYNEKPILIGDGGHKFIFINSKKEELVSIMGHNERTSEMLSSYRMEKGINILELKKEVDNFKSLSVKFTESNKEVKLNLN
jgi:hypothetical protein